MEKLLINGKEYCEYEYKDEKEFERDIVKNSKEVFGDKTIYIDVKKLLKGKYENGSIPDGYLFDYTLETKPKLYLVENELQKHSIRDHIAPQMVQFAFNYKHNFLDIKNTIIKYMLEQNVNVDNIAQNAGYRNIDDMLTDIILKEKLGVIIPIDNVSDELKELKNLFRFDIELLKFKKFFNKKEFIYSYDKFNDDVEETNNEISEIDTILVSAEENGFKEEFLGNNRWYAVQMSINMLDKLKYIAVYQKAPIKAITYYAEIANIDLYEDTGKYIIYFNGSPKKLKRDIPLNPDNTNKAPQGRVYTNINRILNANSKTTLDDIF